METISKLICNNPLISLYLFLDWSHTGIKTPIGMSLLECMQFSSCIFLGFNRSDIAWKDAKYAQIWEFLRDEFELTQRFASLDFKLKFVEV